jgi:protein disulfide-isomerase
MKKTMVVAMMVLVAWSAPARTWTNSEGKTVEAELERVKDDQVFLKVTRTRKIVPLEIAKLSEADQVFIKEYEAELAHSEKLRELEVRKSKWHSDFAEAQAESEEFDLPIYFLYTAPEWCGYCVMLEDNILDQKEFKEYAKRNLVLYMADFSEKSDGERWKKNNPQLLSDFPCGGYPCAYLISTEGKKLGSISGCDEIWAPPDYIAKLEGYKKNSATVSGKKRKKQ